MKKRVLNVGDEVSVQYFVEEQMDGIVTRRINIYNSKSVFVYEVYLPMVEEYVYLESKKLTK